MLWDELRESHQESRLERFEPMILCSIHGLFASRYGVQQERQEPGNDVGCDCDDGGKTHKLDWPPYSLQIPSSEWEGDDGDKELKEGRFTERRCD